MAVCVPAVGQPDTATTGERSRLDGSPPGTDNTDSDPSAPPEPCRGADPPVPEDLVVNEILVDVPSGDAGDVNGDGTRSASADEFVELVNRGTRPVDVRGTSIVVDGDPVELGGPEACLRPAGGLVLFGGLADDASPPNYDGAQVMIAESALSLSNSGGSLSWKTEDGSILDRLEWSSPPAESLTLNPQLRGTAYRPHSDLSSARLVSPGTCPDGRPLTTRCPDGSAGPPADAGIDDAADSDS